MTRRLLGYDAREFFEAAGYDVRPGSGLNPSRTIAVEPFEVGRLYERIRAIWFSDHAKPAIVDLLRAVRLDPELLAALETAWILGRDVALHDAACVAIGIEPDSAEPDEQPFWRRALAKRPSHTDGG
jgi:hypothetical protein